MNFEHGEWRGTWEKSINRGRDDFYIRTYRDQTNNGLLVVPDIQQLPWWQTIMMGRTCLDFVGPPYVYPTEFIYHFPTSLEWDDHWWKVMQPPLSLVALGGWLTRLTRPIPKITGRQAVIIICTMILTTPTSMSLPIKCKWSSHSTVSWVSLPNISHQWMDGWHQDNFKFQYRERS